MSEDNPATNEDRPRGGWWSWLTRTLVILSVAVAGTVGVLLHRVTQSRQAIEEAVADMDRTEPGWRLHELEAARAGVPHARNGAWRVQAAAKHLPGPLPEPLRLSLQGEPANQRLSPELAEHLEAELAPLGAALAEARALDGLDTGRFPIRHAPQRWRTEWPHLKQVEAVAQLLQLDTARRGQRGDPGGALASARATVNAGRSIGDEPLLASYLARLSAVRLGLAAARRALGQVEPAPEDLGRLQALLEKEAGHPAFEILLRGERAALHEFLEHWGASGGNNLPEFLERDRVRRDHPRMFSLLRRQLDIAGRPPHERQPLQRELDEDIRALPQGPLKKVLAGTDRLEREERLRLAALRCAIVGLAAERYRRANHAWPAALADLKGLVPADALVNPHTGRPLDYRRRPDGASLAAPEDAEGLVDPAQIPPAFPAEGVFRLWDPAHRGRPPTPRPPPGPR